MFKHLCPECGKNSYSADQIYFAACPYCGCRFSGRYGLDRRREERRKKETSLSINCKGRFLQALSTDLSDEGIGIRISGELPFARGETIEFTARGLQIMAKVIWTTKLNEESLAGLQRLH